MAYVPYAPEFGCPFWLTGPDGTIAAFNDKTDPNFCGYLSDVTGLDSADVRESGDVSVAADGGWHGDFWYGRRPITISGMTPNIVSTTDRAAKLDAIRRASNALRSDAILSWTPTATGSLPMQTWVRRQQPTRFTGGWVKSFQILLVSQFAPLFSQAVYTPSGTSSVTVENHGDYPSAPILRVAGASTNPVITNTTTGAVFKFGGSGAGYVQPPTGTQANKVYVTSTLSGRYYYQVTSVNSVGESTPSAVVSPTGNLDSFNSVQLSWNAAAGATSYKVYRSTSYLMTSPVRIATPTGTSFLDSGTAGSGATIPTTNTAANTLTLASGHYVDIDILNRIATVDGTTSENSLIDYLGSTWPTVVKGSNTFTLSGGGTLTVTFRDNWT